MFSKILSPKKLRENRKVRKKRVRDDNGRTRCQSREGSSPNRKTGSVAIHQCDESPHNNEESDEADQNEIVAADTHEDGCAEKKEGEIVTEEENNEEMVEDNEDGYDDDYGIYNDDSDSDVDDEEDERNLPSNVQHIRVRPMAAKGERTVIEKSQMTLHIKELDKEVEELISIQPSSTINNRDRRCDIINVYNVHHLGKCI